jgi:hypothetical protein
LNKKNPIAKHLRDRRYRQIVVKNKKVYDRDISMAKKAKGLYTKVAHEPVFHKTSIGRNPSLCKMNKGKRRMYKKYRGQGR